MILSPVLLFPLLSPSAPALCPSPLSVVLVLFPDGSSWDFYCYGSPPLSLPSFVWIYQSSSSLSDAFGKFLRASCEPPGNPLGTFWVLLHCICVAITHLRRGEFSAVSTATLRQANFLRSTQLAWLQLILIFIHGLRPWNATCT